MPFSTSSFVRSGKYTLLQQQPIGVGGLGQVYRAREVALNREVAVKAIVPGLPIERHELAVSKLLHEANIHGSLHHPHIVAAHTFEVDSTTGEQYLICDFVAGGSLLDYLRNGPLEEGEAIALALDLLDAVGYLHEQGIIHRDIKPSNILVKYDERRERTVALLADFGIARRLRDAPSTLGVGDLPSLTPEYCAPEQRDPSQLPDTRTDLYAVGLLLAEMVSGGGPYKLRQRAIDSDGPVRGSRHQRIAPHTSSRLALVIDRATEQEPDKRFQTAADFRTALESLHHQRKPVRQRRAVSPVGLALAFLSLLLLVILVPLGVAMRFAVAPQSATVRTAAVFSAAVQTMPPTLAPTDLVALSIGQPTARPSVASVAPSVTASPPMEATSTPPAAPSETAPPLVPSEAPSLEPSETVLPPLPSATSIAERSASVTPRIVVRPATRVPFVPVIPSVQPGVQPGVVPW